MQCPGDRGLWHKKVCDSIFPSMLVSNQFSVVQWWRQISMQCAQYWNIAGRRTMVDQCLSINLHSVIILPLFQLFQSTNNTILTTPMRKFIKTLTQDGRLSYVRVWPFSELFWLLSEILFQVLTLKCYLESWNQLLISFSLDLVWEYLLFYILILNSYNTLSLLSN